MAQIFLTGLAATSIWKMEEQLGNASIVIPLFKILPKRIPGIRIRTNMQFSVKFCELHSVESIHDPHLFSWGRLDTLKSLFNFLFTLLTRIFPIKVRYFLARKLKDSRIYEFLNADLILDLSGDMYSEYLSLKRFVKHSADLLTARNLGIPVISFANSPGPFFSFLKRAIAIHTLNRLSIISNREPASTVLLRELGINNLSLITTCCTSFLLEPATTERVNEILLKEGVEFTARPLVGLCMAGTSFKNIYEPTEEELKSFIPLVYLLLCELRVNVLMIPHVYRTNQYLQEHIHGPDFAIAKALYDAVNGAQYGKQLILFKGFYSPQEIKGVFGRLEMFISGRMHAAIAAMSQAVPTVMLAYGHKQYGMARMLRIIENVYGGKDPNQILGIVKRAWEKREETRKIMRETATKAKEYAMANIDIIQDLLTLPKNKRNSIPHHIRQKWVQRSAQNEENGINLRNIFSDITVPH